LAFGSFALGSAGLIEALGLGQYAAGEGEGSMRACRGCGQQVDHRYRFCPWCATPLRRKLVEFFRAHAATDPGKALRVSRYLDEGHVRVTVWDEAGEARAAVSVDELEAQRIASFIGASLRPPSVLARLAEFAPPRTWRAGS